MLKSEVNCKYSTKNNIIYRASLRGLKRCTSCGYINGQRALICRNVNCDLRIKRLAAIKPFDPIQLVTYGYTKLYSLRSKEKLLHPRIFVSITETRGVIESRSCAVCYLDNCKYDAFESSHLVCRHIKACKVLTDVAVAEVYPIDKSILWNLNIPSEQKQHLWDLYQLEEKLIHPVQKLNSSIFVVKCVESKNFPAGRLHVTVFSNKAPSKSGKFSCSCKKLKIVLESDNSVVMKQEICDHLLLLLSAILNKTEGKTLYSKFLDSLQHLWMPTCLNTPIVDCVATRPLQIMNDLSPEKCNKPNYIKAENTEVCCNSEDIFNFTEELFAENSIPDFSDIILDVNSGKVSNIQKLSNPKTMTKHEMHIKDPKLNVATNSINDEEIGLNFPNFDSPEPFTNTQTSVLFTENSLSGIDQFQLNHNMQISNENIELAKDIESLDSLESQVMEANNTICSPCPTKQKSLLKTSSSSADDTDELTTKPPTIIIKPTTVLKTFPVQKSIVLRKGSFKIIKIAEPIKKLPAIKAGNIIQISKINPNKTIVLKTNQYVNSATQVVDNCNVIQPTMPQENCLEDKEINSIPVPLLTYESWLDYIIENLNEKIKIHDFSTIENTFHVPEAMFNHFSKSFTLNNKRRPPNKTTVVKNTRYKGHTKYTWYFNQASTVQRIFKSKNMTIELERSYELLPDGSYELYSPTRANPIANKNFRTIYPKLPLHKVFIQFSNNTELCSNNLQSDKCGLKLEWMPSVFPKSNFGLMTIKFRVSVKLPDSIA